MDAGRSLQELEDDDWGEPTYPSRLVTECHRLRRVPLRDLAPEDLRLLLGQEIGLAYLVPLALDHRTVDPFTAGQNYPGDLLEMLLLLPTSYWDDYPELRQRAVEIAALATARLRDDDADIGDPIAGSIGQRLRRFLNAHRPLP
jgi:hypothetical protein